MEILRISQEVSGKIAGTNQPTNSMEKSPSSKSNISSGSQDIPKFEEKQF